MGAEFFFSRGQVLDMQSNKSKSKETRALRMGCAQQKQEKCYAKGTHQENSVRFATRILLLYHHQLIY